MTRSGKDNRFSRRPGGFALVWLSKKGVLPIIGPRTGAQRRQSRRAGEPPNNFAVSTSQVLGESSSLDQEQSFASVLCCNIALLARPQ